jgi:DNA-binding NtrC family response regulator
LRGRLLIVEDEPVYRDVLLDSFGGTYDVVATDSVAGMLRAIQQHFDVLLLDDSVLDGFTTDHLEQLHDRLPGARLIVCTAGERPKSAELALRSGVQSYLVKPVELAELRLATARALEAVRQAALVASLRREPVEGGQRALPLSERAQRVASADAAVLLIGETGSGKTHLARQLHDHSRRAAGPFVAINCASIPESLADAELFGAERGAYTGAVAARPGAFELASTGTLFLDEIGELSPSIQAKLLTVLEERAVRRIGGTTTRPLDTRVMAATHRDLEVEVQAGRFRSDLLYRLQVLTLRVAALRDQREHLAALVLALLHRLAPRRGVTLAPGELERLAAHPWPGNLRELRNALERSLIFDDGDQLFPSRYIEEPRAPTRAAAAPAAAAAAAAPAAAAALTAPDRETIATLEEIEQRHIRDVLARLGGNRAAAARALGIGEATLRRKLR